MNDIKDYAEAKQKCISFQIQEQHV